MPRHDVASACTNGQAAPSVAVPGLRMALEPLLVDSPLLDVFLENDACGGARVEAFRCPERGDGDADPTALNGEVADAARLIARPHGKRWVGVVGLMKDVVAFAPYVRRVTIDAQRLFSKWSRRSSVLSNP